MDRAGVRLGPVLVTRHSDPACLQAPRDPRSLTPTGAWTGDSDARTHIPIPRSARTAVAIRRPDLDDNRRGSGLLAHGLSDSDPSAARPRVRSAAMSQGADCFRAGQSHAAKAAAAVNDGNLELAAIHNGLAENYSRLALAAAIVLNSSSDEAGTYRMAVGSLGI